MEAQIHQRKLSAPEDQSLNIDGPPAKLPLKRKVANAAKTTVWYSSAAFLFVVAMCHTVVSYWHLKGGEDGVVLGGGFLRLQTTPFLQCNICLRRACMS